MVMGKYFLIIYVPHFCHLLTEFIVFHLRYLWTFNSLIFRALYEKIVFLEQKTREQDIIIANMSEQISNYSTIQSNFQQKYCNGCFIWYFKDFNNKVRAMRDNPRIMHYSPAFYTSPYGYK